MTIIYPRQANRAEAAWPSLRNFRIERDVFVDRVAIIEDRDGAWIQVADLQLANRAA